MQSSSFYQNLKALKNFEAMTDVANYSLLPEDWYVIVTDIQNSTQAIEAGRYKEVNFVGAMSIIAILNIDKQVDIPFVFGGDGASILIPPSFYKQACEVLSQVRSTVEINYDFILRVGIIPVQELYKDAKYIYITKYEVSEFYTQAIIKGGGLEYADYLLKNDFDKYTLSIQTDTSTEADFSGLECRWEAIPSPKEEVLSLLIKANDTNADVTYKKLLSKLDSILGYAQERNPIRVENMHLSFDSKKLSTEATLHTNNPMLKSFVIFKMMAINLLGKILMSLGVGEWGGYKKRIFHTTDTEKFDDMFRLIATANKEQTQELESYLQSEYEKGNLIYGIHKSKASLMTCLVFQRHGKHVHFVDGSDGGYALASKDFKQRNIAKNIN